jgi:hypothetical protein
MSTRRTDGLPLSRANTVIGAVLLAGLVTTLALGLWSQAGGLGVALVLGAIGIWRGRRPGATDVTRVDALEYADERDRAIARDGFAVVGVVALCLSVVQFVVVSVVLPEWTPFASGQLLLLAVVGVVANRVAASRR